MLATTIDPANTLRISTPLPGKKMRNPTDFLVGSTVKRRCLVISVTTVTGQPRENENNQGIDYERRRGKPLKERDRRRSGRALGALRHEARATPVRGNETIGWTGNPI
jgi:hypothetical protein